MFSTKCISFYPNYANQVRLNRLAKCRSLCGQAGAQDGPSAKPVIDWDVGSCNLDAIRLSSTFNRQSKSLSNAVYSKLASGSPTNLNLYCCGPTVYDHSHLGHAISYIRCDLVTRTLRTFCNMNVFFAMNITDIDDKIISKSNETGTDYINLSNEYYRSFLDDMNALRINPADTYLKVTDKVDVICDYIRTLYDKGFAYYSSETGDINFDYEKFIYSYAIENDLHKSRILQTNKSIGKKSPKDFALWKASKESEPKWSLKLSQNLSINGRPGWHVECSALSHHLFGANLDIHFGGFDLIFPHHHCESCCSHAYLYEPSAHKPLYTSSKIWLHSGHLILRSEKMSKSLGNVVLIKDFLKKYSPNVIRLLCIRTHYRSEIDFDLSLLHEMSAYDEKLREFVSLIDLYIYKLTSGSDLPLSINEHHNHDVQTSTHLSTLIDQVEHQIIAGILDDLNLNLGLDAILDLCRHFSKVLSVLDPLQDQSILLECIRLRHLIRRWLHCTGLDYGFQTSNADHIVFAEHITHLRSNFRQIAIGTLKTLKQLDKSAQTSQKESIAQLREQAQQMLTYCDQTRSFMELHGIKLKDQPSDL